MPHLPVIPNVIRVTFNWLDSENGISAHNVLHFGGTVTNEQDVGEGIEGSLNDISGEANPFALLRSNMSCQSLDLLQLDGESGTVTYNFAEFEPSGGGAGEAVPEACGVVTLRTGLAGPRHRGRCFLGPLGETSIDTGLIAPGSAVTDTTDYWQAWNDQLASYALSLVVASYKHHDANDVTSFRCEPFVGTQRRRLLAIRPR